MTNSNNNRKKLNKSSENDNKQKGILTKPLFIFLTIASIGIIIFNTFNHSYFKISQVFIEGNIQTSDEQILKLIENPIGKSIFTYNTNKNKNILESEDNIEEAIVEKKYPDDIKIKIKEIYPFMKISKGKKQYIISNSGKVMDSDSTVIKKDLVVLNANIKDLKVGDLYTDNQSELEFLEKIQTYNYGSSISELNFENKDEIGIIIRDIQIEFGDLTNTDYKLKLLDSVLKDIDQKEVSANKIILNQGDNPVVEVDKKSLNQENNE